MRPPLSLAILTRDEERLLPAAIASAEGLVDEVVVRDTGSHDGTVDTARALGARVVRGSWRDDFSEARNLLLEAVSTEWVLMLDADERLVGGGDALDALFAGPYTSAFHVEIQSPVGFGRVERRRCVRLFRRAHGLHFEHRVHERLVGAGTARPAPLTIAHDGWMPSRRAAKSRRNLALIEFELAEHPGEPYLLWRLGEELGLLGFEERAAEALEGMADALRSLDGMALARLDWAPEALALWADGLEDCGQGARALGLATRIALAHPERPLARFVHARALANSGRSRDAVCAAASLLVPSGWRCDAPEESAVLTELAPALLEALGQPTAR